MQKRSTSTAQPSGGHDAPWAFLSVGRQRWLMLVVAALVGLPGCESKFNDTYGQASGLGMASVNGTRVLADMFTERGHQVETRQQLSPKLRSAETIVWFPDDFAAPSSEVLQWLEDWLGDEYGRTLIYVGRDFDAAPLYWKKVAALAPPDSQPDVAREQADAERDHLLQRKEMPDSVEIDDWCKLLEKLDHRDVRTLSGPWSTGIHAAAVEVELNGRMIPQEECEILLASEQDALVARRDFEYSASRVIMVANGSFLLNVPLVNHEHRKLAGRLIDVIGDAPQRVVFLESRAGGPPISDKDADPDASLLALLKVWPQGGVLLHFALLGLIFALSRWPIFGRPRAVVEPVGSDFGTHVAALGQLLSRTRDREYALARLARWRDGKVGSDPAAKNRGSSPLVDSVAPSAKE